MQPVVCLQLLLFSVNFGFGQTKTITQEIVALSEVFLVGCNKQSHESAFVY
jgi:hypothetical protein